MQPPQDQLDATVAQIHRLFAAPLPWDDEPFPWYTRPGEIADLNAVLDIADDGQFVYAAVWQLHGSELSVRKRKKWQQRLRRTSRASFLVTLRLKTAGRRHAVRTPGLGWALLLDPPGSFLLHRLPGRSIIRHLRRRIVAWRHDVACARSPGAKLTCAPCPRDTAPRRRAA